MKRPANSVIITAGGILLIGGVIVVAQTQSTEYKGASPEGQSGSAAVKSCPSEVPVEDAALKIAREPLKQRFVTDTCSRTAAGELNACLDPDEESCKKRLSGLTRLVKNPGECLARPAEMFCSMHVLATDRSATVCFETKQMCDAHHEKKRRNPKICRIAPACERFSLPLL